MRRIRLGTALLAAAFAVAPLAPAFAHGKMKRWGRVVTEANIRAD